MSAITVFLLLQQKAGDRGSLARASGDYCIVVAHNTETGVSRIKLPSGSKKVHHLEPARMKATHSNANPFVCTDTQDSSECIHCMAVAYTSLNDAGHTCRCCQARAARWWARWLVAGGRRSRC